MARDETTMTGEKITDEQIRQQYRENRETPGLDTLMIAIHSQDSELRHLARVEFAAAWNARHGDK